jgi:hypothetical protein
MGNTVSKVIRHAKPAARVALRAAERSHAPKDTMEAAAGVAKPKEPVLPEHKVMFSGPRAGPDLHDKNPTTVSNLESFDGAITDRPDDSLGAKNFTLWQAMQLVRKLAKHMPPPPLPPRTHAKSLPCACCAEPPSP